MDSKYNVFVSYRGDNEFKFTIKKIGEVSISRTKPIFIYNADIDVVNNLRTLKRMLIDIIIGAKPTGAYKIYDLDTINKEKERLMDSRVVADRRGYEAVSNNEVKSILSSGTSGPIIDEEVKPVITEEPKKEEKKTTTKKVTKKKSTKKTSKK